MHCDCCDHLLDDIEATARFTETGNFVNMCKKCIRFLPKDLQINYRNDLKGKEREEKEEQAAEDKLYDEDEDGYEEWE